MGLRGWIKRLERDARGDLASLELLDGSRYYYAPVGELYLFSYDCLEANPRDWPGPPEVLVKVCEARDPAEALEQIMSPAIFDIFPYSKEIIVTDRRLEPRSIVAGRDRQHQAVEDLSE